MNSNERNSGIAEGHHAEATRHDSGNGLANGHDGLEHHHGESKPAVEPEIEYPTGFRFLTVATSLVLSIFLIALDTTIVSTAIPRITDEFKSVNDVGWYGSAFFLTLASFQGAWGKVFRYFPLKTSFIAATIIFEVGSLICAVAQDSVTLIVGRAIAGWGAAGVSSGCYTILAFSAAPEKRAAMTGLIGASFTIASFAGPLIGGAFTQTTTWRWCFYVNLPIGGLAVALLAFFFKTPANSRTKGVSWKEIFLQMDPIGIVLVLCGTVCFLLALEWGGVEKTWSNRDVIGTLVGFGVLVLAFIANECFWKERAMIPSQLFKKRVVVFCCAFIFFFAGAFFIPLYYLPIYFQSVDNASPANSGVRTLPLVLAIGLFSIVSGGLIQKVGYYLPLMFIAGTCCTVGSGLLYTLTVHSHSNEWIGYQALAGIGVGLGIQVPMMVNQASVKMEDLSAISATTLFFQCIGGAFFVQGAQSAFQNKLIKQLPKELPGISVKMVLATGASELNSTFSGAQLQGILRSYMAGLKDAFILATALAAMATVVCLFSGFKKVSQNAETGPNTKDTSSEGDEEKTVTEHI